MLPGFPAIHRGRIDAKPFGHLPLRQTEPLAGGCEAFRKRVRRWLWIVPQESDDGRDVADLGDGCVDFPIGNREFVNANLFRDLLLEELEVQSSRADMVP